MVKAPRAAGPGAAAANPTRKTGIAPVSDVPWGTHLCLFYESAEDLADVLVPYFKAGLENNEFCMWVTSEPLGVEDAARLLQKAVPNLRQFVEDGQIEILDYSQWYTRSGTFEADRVLQGWIEKDNQALRKGFDGLRLTGNTFWLQQRDWKDFMAYEATVDRVIGQHRMIALCCYPLEKCGAPEVIDVVSTHQSALIRRAGRWETIESGQRKRAESDRNKLEGDLKDRVKELHGMYQLAKSIRDCATLEELFQDVVALIPPAWQYPEITCGRVRFDGREYVSAPFQETEWYLSSDILFDGHRRGTVEVFYLKKPPELAEGPFLNEERDLIHAIARALSEAIERKLAEEATRSAYEQLAEQQRREKEHVETELEKVRGELVRTTRLAAIGQISASIAHDLRNPLGAASNAVYYLRHGSTKDASKTAEYLGIIDQEIGVANRIIGKLLDMARGRELGKKAVDLGRAVKAVFDAAHGTEQMRCRMALCPDPFLVQADPDQLRLVIGNLLSNTVQATRGQGEFIVEASRGPEGDTILFRDTGPGIAPEIRQSVFEPLVTSRRHRTGLGLTICREIVWRHGGTIETIDHEEGGAAFEIWLPRQ